MKTTFRTYNDALNVISDQPGYTDNPQLPNSEYCVHDARRPHPPVIEPGDGSNLRAEPPEDASVLLKGNSLEGWIGPDSEEASWTVKDGFVEVNPETGDIHTTDTFGDCQLHLEWAPPEEVSGDGQGRGNSGIFLMDRYEIQVLDNYNNPMYAVGHAGAVYGQQPPLVNACRPPGEWQSFDIIWHAPEFDGDQVVSPATVTVFHNSLLVQDATRLIGQTTHGEIEGYESHPPTAPLRLQDHGDQVRYRNIWYRPIES